MKNVLSFTLLLMFSIAIHAQQEVTKFLGIPVDGSKTEMKNKLKAKGFKEIPGTDALTGEFNGGQVGLFIYTNNNKVWRIAVVDAIGMGVRDTQIRFNSLCEQFANNPKYVYAQDYQIPETEDVSYEITVHKKRYEANFYQVYSSDSTSIQNKIQPILQSKYTEEQLKSPSEDILSEIKTLWTKYADEYIAKRHVWFMISEEYGKYRILMFYDNEYNHANGEEL